MCRHFAELGEALTCWSGSEQEMTAELQVPFCLVKEEGVILATGEWSKLHNDELTNLYSSSNSILVIKSRRLIWSGM
jgi:hypothetical protein